MVSRVRLSDGWLLTRAGWRHGLLHLWLCLIWTGLASLAHATPLGSPASSPAHIERIEWLHDPTGELGIRGAVAAAADGHFRNVLSARSAGVRPGTVWLRLTVWGGHEVVRPQWLLLNSPLLLEAQLYFPTQAGFESGVTTGLLRPAETSELPSWLPIFEIPPAPGQMHVYFVRMRSDVMVWIDPHLFTTIQLLGWFKQSRLLLGILGACHVLLMLSSLWFARYARDQSYAWLAALTAANLLFSLGIGSRILQSILHDHMDWFIPLISAIWAIRVPLAGAFALSYLRMGKQPWSRRYLLLLTIVAIADWLLSLGAEAQIWARWYHFWAIAQLCLLLLFAAYATLRRTPGAGLLTLAFIPPLLGGLHSTASIQDGQPLTFWTQNAVRFGFAGFLIVMQYAAFRRYRGLYLAYEQTQRQALEISRAAERTLEECVATRTRELEAALITTRAALDAEGRAREEQRQFFLTMQHELRTPLAVIDAANRNLQHDLPADSEAVQLRCQRIGRAVEQLNTLLKNSLLQRRLDHEQTTLQVSRTELRPLLYEACDAARLLSPDHALVLQSDDLPEYWICDPTLTVLALRTLAINAVRYTPAGTRVTVRGNCDAEGLYLEVHDDGPGVPAEDLPHLFERYYRARSAAGSPGTGLGLPLARKAIEQQGGRLEIDSAEHEGFTAVIWLPRQPDPAPLTRHLKASPCTSGIPTAGADPRCPNQ